MRPRDKETAKRLEACLVYFDKNERALPGIRDSEIRKIFVEQLLESLHRVKYVSVIRERKLSERSLDPNDEIFDPLKAAILHQRQGHIDEAYWLIFLFIHFGKHARTGWRYIRNIYGCLGDSTIWSWDRVSANTLKFREWLHIHQDKLKLEGGFGNHRKYESLDAYSQKGTGAVIESYVRWIGVPRTHQELMDQVCQQAEGDPHKAFDRLYHLMEGVMRFGRTARFEYLAMVGKLGLAPIEPGYAYLQNSTGPIKGARLLFGVQNTPKIKEAEIDLWLVELNNLLQIGMQVFEDALCNWQKSPDKFKRFRG